MRKLVFSFWFALLCLSFSACGVGSEQIQPSNSEAVSSIQDAENDSSGAPSEISDEPESSQISFEEVLTAELIEAFGTDTVVNYNASSLYAETDELVICIAIFPEGAEDCYKASRDGNEASELASTWDEFQNTIVDLNNTIIEQSGKRCEISVCSENNHHLKLITVFDGKIVYDWLIE